MRPINPDDCKKKSLVQLYEKDQQANGASVRFIIIFKLSVAELSNPIEYHKL